MSNVPQYSDQPAPRPGMSGDTKFLLGCVIVAGVLMVLACGGAIAFFIAVGWYVENSTVKDPAEIRRLTGDIVTIELPGGLEPKMGFNFQVPFTDKPGACGVVYGSKNHASLMMFEALVPMDEDERNKAQSQIEQAMSQQGRRQKSIRIEESKAHDLEIHGKPAHFTVAKGVDTADKQEMWQVTGDFEGEKGPVMFVFTAPAEDYTEEDILKMLDSMK